MSLALQRQHVLAAVPPVRTHFADLLDATGLRKWELADRLRELVASGEIVHEQVPMEDGYVFPMFRRADLFDQVKA